jgi:hypothetical protein
MQPEPGGLRAWGKDRVHGLQMGLRKIRIVRVSPVLAVNPKDTGTGGSSLGAIVGGPIGRCQ